MKFSIAVLFAVFLLVACGEKQGHTPIISDLSFGPNSAAVTQGGSMVRVDYQFRYYDLGADVKTVIFLQSVPGEPPLSNTFDPQTSLLEGSISNVTFIKTSTAQTIDFEVYVTDSQGNRSNTLIGAFTVTP